MRAERTTHDRIGQSSFATHALCHETNVVKVSQDLPLELEYRRFNYAHMQHHAAFDAIDNGQSGRAEAIMREHANATLRYAELFGVNPEAKRTIRVIGVSGEHVTASK